MVGATWTTVCQTVRTLGVVQRNGVGEPTGTPLNDAGHLTACPGFRLAEKEQGMPAGAFMMVRRRLVPVPKLLNAQMGRDRSGFDPYRLAQFRIIPGPLSERQQIALLPFTGLIGRGNPAGEGGALSQLNPSDSSPGKQRVSGGRQVSRSKESSTMTEPRL